MIRKDELNSKTSFKEWASLFSGEYLVMIVIYADESGTHDPSGKLQGTQHAIIAGFAAQKSVWDKFEIAWRAVLNKYKAPFFHGRELEGARLAIVETRPESKQLLKNPYYLAKWDLEKIEAFRKALTKVASEGNKIPIIGSVNIPAFNRVRGKIEFVSPDIKLGNDPYKICMSHFFQVYHDETWLQWRNFKSDVSFFFDRNDKKEWQDAIHEVFSAYEKEDTRMRGPYFDCKKKLIQLQAADLLAYRVRQLTEDKMNNNLKLEPIDWVLLRNFLKSAQIKYPNLKGLLNEKRNTL